MKTIHLQVQEDYLEDFLAMLPHDKVKVLREDHLDLQRKFSDELNRYKSDETGFVAYHENMKEIDAWIMEGKQK